jgi:hypothetical protein
MSIGFVLLHIVVIELFEKNCMKNRKQTSNKTTIRSTKSGNAEHKKTGFQLFGTKISRFTKLLSDDEFEFILSYQKTIKKYNNKIIK